MRPQANRHPAHRPVADALFVVEAEVWGLELAIVHEYGVEARGLDSFRQTYKRPTPS